MIDMTAPLNLNELQLALKNNKPIELFIRPRGGPENWRWIQVVTESLIMDRWEDDANDIRLCSAT